jgi:hypothetical protein
MWQQHCASAENVLKCPELLQLSGESASKDSGGEGGVSEGRKDEVVESGIDHFGH